MITLNGILRTKKGKKRSAHGKAADSAWQYAKIHWDGSFTLTDPVGYFKGSPNVKDHLEFLARHKERLKNRRDMRARIRRQRRPPESQDGKTFRTRPPAARPR